MKKKFLAMLLSTLLVANISACNYVPENEPMTDSSSSMTEKEKTIENTEITEKANANTPKDNTKELINPSALDYFIPMQVGGYNTLRELSQPRCADALFGYDCHNQCYAYIPAWEAYFQVPLPEYEEPRDALISGENLWVSSATSDGDHVTTYQFAKDGTLIESYDNDFQISYMTHGYEEAWLYNWYQEDLLYAFFFEDTMKTSECTDYVIHKFQSTDCGKSWTHIQDPQFEFFIDYMESVKMFTNDYGAIIIKYGGHKNAYGTDSFIYLTHDGGGTWSPMKPSYPVEWGKIESSVFESLTYEDQKYILLLTVNLENSGLKTITFVSEDFLSWEMLS